jgi:two-component system sensor histidine kinase KdpD
MRDVTQTPATSRGRVWDYVKVVAAISLITLAGWFSPLSYNALGYAFLLCVIALSLNIGRWPALAAAVLSGAAWDFFFVPPRLSFAGIHFDEGLLLTTFFAASLIGSQLAALRSVASRAELLAASHQMHQTLLDSISHEMMTPMAVFRTGIEQLDTDDAVKRDRVIVELKVAAHRLDDLFTNLLNQNRLESGVLKPILDWCDCHELVVAARRSVGSRLGDHPVVVEIHPDMPIFRADPALMEHAITQLLLNAAIHTPPGSEIRVEARLAMNTGQILISVSDKGPGVPLEMRNRVFDRFVRGPDARTGGLGLGLSIVSGFMRAQGGKISVDSAPGGGARFTLSIPHSIMEAVPIG